MDVLIVGAGSMGKWFARAIDARITFTDVDAEVATDAADRVGGGTADINGTDRYDIVCVAVPMSHVEEAIADHAPRAQRAVVDLAGVMAGPLEAMATHAPDLERLSLHPLFAPERAPGSIPVVRDRSGPVTDALLADLSARGNDVIETTAAEHDAAMETVQAATHAAILSFALAAESVPDGFETPVFEGMCDLANVVLGGNPRVYADIQRTFDGAEAVAEAAARIAETSDEDLEVLYREATIHWQETDDSGTIDAADDIDDSGTIDAADDIDDSGTIDATDDIDDPEDDRP